MTTPERLFVDAHVHLHDCFPVASFLNAAVRNMRQAAGDLNVQVASSRLILLLTESSGNDAFQRLADYAGGSARTGHDERDSAGRTWTFHQTEESGGLQARRSDGAELFVAAGRQIVTQENLEVLALMTPSFFQEREPLAQTVQSVHDAGGIPVIPWGFGKWMGRRGRVLEGYVEKNPGRVWLGDNGGRPMFRSRPALFSVVEQQGGRVLPGSDPLPFASEAHNVASFGFMAEGPFIPEQPLASLKNMLHDPETSLRPYGRLERPMRFARNQIAMQFRKRMRS